MKRFRIFYYLLMLASLLYGLYSGNRICYTLFFMQILILLAALALNLWTILSFSYVQTLNTREAEKGQTVTLHLGIYNDKPFPFTHMKIHILAPAPEECQDVWINLAPRQETSFDFIFSLPYRGEYEMGMTRLDIQDLFGLFPMHIDMRWLSYYRTQTVLVYPRTIHFRLPASSQSSATGLGQNLGPLTPGSEEFSHLRPFLPGDLMARIHWKSSIKTRSLKTRQYTDPSGESCLIFIDTQKISKEADRIADQVTECAAALLYAHLVQEDPTRLACGDLSYAQLSESFSLSDYHRCHQWLAMLPFRQEAEEAGAEALHALIHASPVQKLYVLGPTINSACITLLESFPVPCHYWIGSPLPNPAPPLAKQIQLASFHEKETAVFLHDQLGGDVL